MDFPYYKSTSQKGNNGLTILTHIVQKKLGWIVRPNHNETDFGIDAYLDLITEFGQVTGKTIASQVKTGGSYFNEKNNLGWVYRDDMSHLNYYLNHDIPVVVFLVDDIKEEVYWCYCDPMQTEKAGENWKITIPFNQKLEQDSREILTKYVSPVKDYVSQLNHFWEENERLKESERLIFLIEKEDIQSNYYNSLIAGLNRIQINPTLVSNLRGKVEILILGYDFDKRELPEIPEVKKWVRKIFNDTIGLSYFLPKQGNEGFFLVLMMCFMKYEILPDSDFQRDGKTTYKIKMDNTDSTFLNLVFHDLNKFTHKHNLPKGTNMEISFEIGEKIIGQ
ncbi:DUF4365 domain-containing protein [Roseivirga sp.]|uniref:DUF4365 domain-containing protein n=1 Tax=Roseivirga sp. TaxID=1964215 RepID=UPI002B276A8C|nr:DUF4365 domain-containing protein [Roseivirga sp.]